MRTSQQVYAFQRAKSEIDKAKAMVKALRNGGSFNFRVFVNHLLNAMNLVANELLKKRSRSLSGFETYVVMKDVVEQNSLKSVFYETYFFLRGLQHKEVKKVSQGFMIGNWKSKQVVKEKDLAKFCDKVEEFVKRTRELTV